VRYDRFVRGAHDFCETEQLFGVDTEHIADTQRCPLINAFTDDDFFDTQCAICIRPVIC